MRKILAGVIFFLILATAPLAQAAFNPLCPTYVDHGDCVANCPPADKASGDCTPGTCASAPDSAACKDAAAQKPGDNPVVKTIAKATKVISLIAGFAAVIIIVVSGIGMITSAGNTESVASARKRLTGAVIGLALASFAWLLSSLVINQIL